MIILKHPANIGGMIRPAGAAVTGLTAEQEKLYIDAGTAEYPKQKAEPKAKAKSGGKPTHKELDAIAVALGITFAKDATIDQKLEAIEAAQKQIAASSARKTALLEMPAEELVAKAEALSIAVGDGADSGDIAEAIMAAEDAAASDGDQDQQTQVFGRSGKPQA